MSGAKRAKGIGFAARADLPAIDSALDQLHTGRAILQCYIDTIPDERADDRYVLWAVLAQLDKVYTFLD
jgi:hypothetical protein